MVIRFERDVLLRSLNFCQGVVSTRTTLPILSYFLLEADKDRVEISATDLEVGVKVNVEAEVSEGGKITLPGRKTLELLREFPPGSITLSCENNLLTFKNENIWVKILTLSPEEFPSIPEVKGKEIKISGEKLKEMIKKTSFSVSHEETRYMLNGIYTTIFEKIITMVSTDGRRLSCITRDLDTVVPQEMEAILPLKACNEVLRIMEDEEVSMLWGEKQVKFSQPGVILVCRVIEGEFPDYKSVIPRSFKCEVIIDKEIFQEAVRRAHILTRDKGLSMRLSLQQGKLTVSTKVPEQGESTEDIPVEYSGEPLEIAFDPGYILDVLKVLDVDKIFLGMNDPEKPALIRPQEGEDYLYVVMPMKL